MTDGRVVNSFLLDNEVMIICTLKETLIIDCREKGSKPKPRQYKTPKSKTHIPQGKKLGRKLHEFNEVISCSHNDILGDEYDKKGVSECCQVSFQTKARLSSTEAALTRVYNCAWSIPAHNLSNKICKLVDCAKTSSWICRFKYDDLFRALVPINPNNESIILKGVKVCSLLEFS